MPWIIGWQAIASILWRALPVVSLLLIFAAYPALAQTDSQRPLQRRITAALDRGDLRGLAAALDAYAGVDEHGAKEAAFRIVEGTNQAAAVTGISFLGRVCSTGELIGMANQAERRQNRTASRWFVRCIAERYQVERMAEQAARVVDLELGEEADDEQAVDDRRSRRGTPRRARGRPTGVVPTLIAMQRSPDEVIKRLSAYALAEIGDLEALTLLDNPGAPIGTRIVRRELADTDIVTQARMGILTRLTGHSPETVGEVRELVHALRSGRPIEPPAVRSFRTYFLDTPLCMEKDLPRIDARLPAGLDAIAEGARHALRPIFGPVHLPAIRLIFCNSEIEIGRFLNVPGKGFGGVQGGNTIAMSTPPNRWTYSAGVMCHEYIHAMHAGMFSYQPRWLVEGIGTRFEPDALRHTLRLIGIEDREVTRWSRTTPNSMRLTELIGWEAGGSSDPRESFRYSAAASFVGFLMDPSEFDSPETRMFALMSRMDERAAARTTLESLYAMPLDELERRWNAWLARNRTW